MTVIPSVEALAAHTHEFRWRVRARPEAVGQVRADVSGVLAYWNYEGLTDDVCLCLTELLANVAKHVRRPGCVLKLQDTGTGVRLTVSDGSHALPTIQEPDTFAESGRGMQLVSALADCVGSAPTASGKDVWAEFRGTA